MKNNLILKILSIVFLISFNVYAADDLKPEDAIKYFNQAKLRFEEGLYIKSLEDCKTALKINPYYKECFKLIGDIYYQSMQYDSAIFYYQSASKISPYYLEPYLKLGDIYFEKQEYDTAIKYYSDMIKFDKSNIEGRIGLMKTYIETEDYEKVMDLYNFIEKIKPDDAKNNYTLGKLYYKQGDLDKAFEQFKSVEFKLSEVPEVLNSIGKIYLQRKSYDNAKYYFEKALNYKVNRDYAKTELNKIYIKFKMYDEIFNLWKRFPVRYIDAYHIGFAHYKKALTLLTDGDSKGAQSHFDDAVFYFRAALALNANDEISRYYLERILIRTKPVDDDNRKKYSEFHLYKGIFYKNRVGKIYASLIEMLNSLKLNPQNAESRVVLSEIYEFLKYYDSLKFQLERVLELDSNNTKAHDKYDYFKYNVVYSDKLQEFLKQGNVQKNIKYRMAIKITSDLFQTEHINIDEYYTDLIGDFFKITHKFNVLIIPEQYKTFNGIENFARALNSDALLVLDVKETDDKVEVVGSLNELTKTKAIPLYSVDRIRRSPHINIEKVDIIRSGKLKNFNSVNSLHDKIDEMFPASGLVQKLYPNSLIVNLGYRQNVKKGDTLKVYNRTVDKEEFIGEIEVSDVSEWYSLCDVFSVSVLEAIKTSDVVIYTKPEKNK